MERGDLLEANGGIFAPQGKALNEVAADDIRVTVTGNPANTNALIAMSNAPRHPHRALLRLTRLDHNRAISQLAAKLGVPVTEVRRMTIWGNHSATQYPDLFHAEVGGRNAAEAVGDQVAGRHLHPDRGQARCGDHRGARRVLGRLGRVGDDRHARTWVEGTPEGDWVSMSVRSDGSYGVQEGIVSSFPVTVTDGRWEVVQGLEIDDFSRERIDASVAELVEERDAVKALGLI